MSVSLIAHDSARLSRIPCERRIRVLHLDSSIVIVEKPCNLRSVPGNLHAVDSNQSPRTQKTSQEAWIAALESFKEEIDIDHDDLIDQWLSRLAKSCNLASIPRKSKPFIRYWERNRYKVVSKVDPNSPGDDDVETVAKNVYNRALKRQRSLLNLPEATAGEESAYGQLIMLLDIEQDDDNLFVVHRLDCETSGVMVFARTCRAASFLCKAWRTPNNQVSKKYLACVKRWPPIEEESKTEGIIELPLSPSHERPKWKVDHLNGKKSTTLWWLRSKGPEGIVLELAPLTGRTHQLRVHLAKIGGGIEGDSLYGDNPIKWDPSNLTGHFLHLHAEKLSFPHPDTNEMTEFFSRVNW